MVIRGIIYLYHLITYPIRSTVKAQTFSDDYRDLLSKNTGATECHAFAEPIYHETTVDQHHQPQVDRASTSITPFLC